MGKVKRKFIEGHSYIEMYNFTTQLSFWELGESYKAVKKYMSENHDLKIPVCVRLKTGDIRVKKYDEQIGLDPRNYYSNAKDLASVVDLTYRSRLAIQERFLSGDIRKFEKLDISDCNPVELLNLKVFLESLRDKWVYLDLTEDEDGKFHIFEVIDPEIIRTIHKNDLTSIRERNIFLAKYVNNEDTSKVEEKALLNLVNHFRPAENLLEEVDEAIRSL